ncbi:MAG TPA: hypothetical protein VN947_12345 [Polyangia bacterium]|nr:hypothetical protein [Polyangia bacterium]
MSFGSRAALVLGLVLFAFGCTSSNVSPYVMPAPAPLSVAVTTDPPARDDGSVPRNARFVVQLDGYPDPDTVGFGPVELRSGGVIFDIDVRVDLVGRAVVVTPHSLLAPGVQYDLLVSGLVTLDNRTQGDDVVASVQVGTDDGTPFPPPAAPTWNGRVRDILGGCAPYCHSQIGASMRPRTPTRELDLTGDPRDTVFGLIDVQAVGLRGTPAPLLRVSPFNPARSVLLRKLIGGDPLADSIDAGLYPSMRVDGRRMPIPLDESQPALPPLSDDELRTVQDWIAAGAPID